MSESAYLTCPPCQVILPLGKPVQGPDGHLDRFNLAGQGYPANSANPPLTKALWKFLAAHAGHPLRVKFSYEPDFETIAAFQEIGGDQIGDVPFEEYVRDWTG